MRTSVYTIIAAGFLSGCGPLLSTLVPPNISNYQAPAANSNNAVFENEIAKPFEEVWNDLIDHAAQNFFAIDHTDRDSGLITLSFSAPDAGSYIDCGSVDMAQTTMSYTTYVSRQFNIDLSGRINVFVRSIEEAKTTVRVNARYIYRVGSVAVGLNTWTFDSGGSRTVRVINPTRGTGPTRTCQPTYELEQSILAALD